MRQQGIGRLPVGKPQVLARLAEACEHESGRTAGQRMRSAEDFPPDMRFVGLRAGGQAIAEQAPRGAVVDFGRAQESLHPRVGRSDRTRARRRDRRSAQDPRHLAPEARRAAGAQAGVPGIVGGPETQAVIRQARLGRRHQCGRIWSVIASQTSQPWSKVSL